MIRDTDGWVSNTASSKKKIPDEEIGQLYTNRRASGGMNNS